MGDAWYSCSTSYQACTGCIYPRGHSPPPEFPVRPGRLQGMGSFTWVRGVVLGKVVYRVPPSSFLFTLSEVLQACSIKEPILFMLSFPSASFRLCGAVLDLAICEVSYKVYVNGVSCSGLRGRAALAGATGSTYIICSSRLSLSKRREISKRIWLIWFSDTKCATLTGHTAAAPNRTIRNGVWVRSQLWQSQRY